MSINYLKIKAGIRSSKLSILQSEDAAVKLERLFPCLKIELVKFSSPGDRDKATPISESPEDFFTKDLDSAVLNFEIDFAIHSAKDVPCNLNPELDMFYLPWKEDNTDSVVARKDWDLNNNSPKVGSSSQRRGDFSKKRWTNALVLPIRGNIEERIAQLDAGFFDIIIMATAALNRLKLKDRISEKISLNELPTPEGQGQLAITFKKGNPVFDTLKQYFLKSVVFAGAGIGNSNFASVATINALKNCEICFYDALLDSKLLDHLPRNSVSVYVGKRAGGDNIKQKSISEMIVHYARQGKQIVRLKGGDPGLFGRLTEETTPLENLHIPFYVIPGISSISAATTMTGLMLTKRDASRGFVVATLQKAGSYEPVPISISEASSFPLVFLMTTSKIKKLKEYLLSIGKTQAESLAVVFNAGCIDQRLLFSNLEKIEDDLNNCNLEDPSIIIVGHSSEASNLFRQNGALAGKKILLTCSKALYSKAENTVLNYLGIPLSMPLIDTKLNDENLLTVFENIDSFDWIILTSPSAVRHFLEAIKKCHTDIRRIPKIFAYGKQSEAELKLFNLSADATNNGDLETSIFKVIPKDSKILRLRSNLATSQLSDSLTGKGYFVQNYVLYITAHKLYDKLPLFDDVVFASSSAVRSFISQFGKDALYGKRISTIGTPPKLGMKSFACF